ncbi:unnamed protein product [Ectocarpus sp. CCAP 1310/34]|nr:unnamed protein product [Ectocarpus sp. CCAP 1310/34]
MAMPGGGYGGYGGGDGYNHAGSNGVHSSNNGGHRSYRGKGGVGVMDGRHQEEEEEEDEEDLSSLEALVLKLEEEKHTDQHLAHDTQAKLEMRAVAHLEVERGVRRMQQAHEEKVKAFLLKAQEINEDCRIRDNKIKELQQLSHEMDEEMAQALTKRKETVEQVKREEREAFRNQERSEERPKRHASSSGHFGSGSGEYSSGGGGGHSNGGMGMGMVARVGDMGRRTQSSSGVSFSPRGAYVGNGVAGGRAGGGREIAAAGRDRESAGGAAAQSNAQPKPFEQIRQACVEDTLTDFFGL